MGERKLTREEVAKFLENDQQFAEEYFSTKATSHMVDKWITKHGKDGAWSSDGTPGPLESTEKGAAILKHFRKSMSGAGGSLKSLISGSPKPKTLRRSRTVLKEMNEKELFMELIRDIANELDISTLSHKILMNVSFLTNGDRCSLFLVRGGKDNRYLVSKLFDVNENSTLEESIHSQEDEIRIPFGKGIVGHVALTKETVNIKNAYEDPRFNREIDKKTGYRTHSILCMPICSHEGDVIGVAQIINKISGDHEFTHKDEQVFKNYLTFCGIGLMNAQLFEMSVQEYKRNQMLLQLARGIFEEQSSLDGVVQKMLTEAITLLKCERILMFILEEHEEGMTLFERMGKKFHKGLTSHFSVTHPSLQRNSKIKNMKEEEVAFLTAFDLCAKDKEVKKPGYATMEWSAKNGIAKHVATTGETLNIEDAENDTRFKVGFDEGTGFSTQNLLCMPIYNSEHKVVGVAQLLNKISGQPFQDKDVNVFEAFAIFCGLGIHNTTMYENACKLMAKQAVALEVLSYHATAQPEETDKLKKMEIKSAEEFNLYSFKFDDLSLPEDGTLTASVRMFQECDLINKFHVPYDVMCRWLLSVKKNYRNVTYHNWRHAFNVAQTMFAMVKSGGMDVVISDLEVFALLVACFCHDLDHRGTNNAYQQKSESPLSTLYGTSTMEHHHFDHCIMILNSEGNNVFQSLSGSEYRSCIKMLESAILSTDLALYFKKRGDFTSLVKDGEKRWHEPTKRDLLRGMMMTACDVSAITKPWEIQRRVAELVAGEFFEQGDLEKMQLGQQPIAMMDREKKDELPKMQVGFIDAICMPVYKTFADLEPLLNPLFEGVINNRKNWEGLAVKYDQLVSQQDDKGNTKSTKEEGKLTTSSKSADSRELNETGSPDANTTQQGPGQEKKQSEVITPTKKTLESKTSDHVDVEKQNMKNMVGTQSSSMVTHQQREALDSKPRSSLCTVL